VSLNCHARRHHADRILTAKTDRDNAGLSTCQMQYPILGTLSGRMQTFILADGIQ